MLKKYKVTINKRGRIPGVGNGPFRRPIYISKECYDNLKALGYPINIIESPTNVSEPSLRKKIYEASLVTEEIKQEEATIVEEEKTVEEIIENDEDILESSSNNQVIEEEILVDEKEESSNEEIVEEEILVDDPDLSAEAYYNVDFLTSKSICKKILNRRNVQYENGASYTLLKTLVSQSNPKID